MKIKQFIRWFISPSKKPIVETNDVYAKLIELQERVEVLETENIETTNLLYQVMNSIEAVDARIDILTVEKWMNKDV